MEFFQAKIIIITLYYFIVIFIQFNKITRHCQLHIHFLPIITAHVIFVH